MDEVDEVFGIMISGGWLRWENKGLGINGKGFVLVQGVVEIDDMEEI